ncbi:MAG: ATP-binding cassette domain-containing protein [Sandaracinaceae bacterium]|nr:ATP-binding cassette domain-containing protein [Sandaracinaceae bacterium]
MSLIELNDVNVTFATEVLRSVKLSIPARGIYALIGPAASGKSVLLRVIAGLIAPRKGRVMLGGDEVTGADELKLATLRRKVGMLFQNYALFDHMSVGENIAFPLKRLFDLPAEEIRTRVAERLERVALPGFEQRMPAGLSGGQKKRVGIARASVTKPPVLLYDEPTAGLDPVTSQKIYDLIRDEQRAEASTVVAISSDVRGLLTIADRVGMVHNGEIIFDGTVAEARATSHPAVRQFIDGRTEGPL